MYARLTDEIDVRDWRALNFRSGRAPNSIGRRRLGLTSINQIAFVVERQRLSDGESATHFADIYRATIS